ncbi:MAG TPA: sulfite reductase subunit A, partial [Bacteroidetes bacterium]|nr:sulfite reductase subunit A [Bacteroidota bacterium]
SPDQKKTAEEAVKAASEKMGRKLNTQGIREMLYKNFDHPVWEETAARCLSCANCTLVCPTCFCSNVEDVTDLTGNHTERWREWDSCFNLEYSKVAGGNFRTSVKARYRQWMTHKLASWEEQFGTLGCVGCGRCITWCPVGLDITKQAADIRAAQRV